MVCNEQDIDGFGYVCRGIDMDCLQYIEMENKKPKTGVTQIYIRLRRLKVFVINIVIIVLGLCLNL